MSQSSPSTLWQTIPDDQLVRLLDRSHTLNGAVLLGLEGLMIEIQARAMNVDEGGLSWRKAVKISGMAKGAVGEALDRISGAFSGHGHPRPEGRNPHQPHAARRAEGRHVGSTCRWPSSCSRPRATCPICPTIRKATTPWLASSASTARYDACRACCRWPTWPRLVKS